MRDIASDIAHLSAALQAWPSLTFFLELTVKSLLIMLLCLTLAPFLRKRSSALIHLLWSVGILCLLGLPLFMAVIPEFEIAVLPPVPAGTDAAAAGLGTVIGWWPPLKTLYLSGIVLLLLYNSIALLRILYLDHAARPSRNAVAAQLLQEILLDEMTDTPVALREHESLISPLSWGLLNPVIILPAESADWSREKLRHVLLHEMHHIKRLDWVTMLAGRYVCAVYWFNPLVWLIDRAMAEQAERACDDAVVVQIRSNASYAGSLVDIARHAEAQTRKPVLAQAIANSFLGSRVLAILDGARNRTDNDNIWVIRSVVTALALVALVSSLRLTTETPPLPAAYRPYVTITLQPEQLQISTPEFPAAEKPELQIAVSRPETDTVITRRPEQDDTGPAIPIPAVTLDAVAGFPDRANPVLIRKQFPEYPRRALQRGLEGFTLIEYDLDAQGRVVDPEIIESSPGEVFDQSALEAIGTYRYQPPTVNGRPVPMRGLRTRFVFELDPDPG